MQPLPEGLTEFRARLVREEPRAPVAALFGSGDAGFLVLCSWCKRARTSDAEWLELETWARREGYDAGGWSPQLSHTICPDCERAMRRQLEEPGPRPG